MISLKLFFLLNVPEVDCWYGTLSKKNASICISDGDAIAVANYCSLAGLSFATATFAKSVQGLASPRVSCMSKNLLFFARSWKEAF